MGVSEDLVCALSAPAHTRRSHMAHPCSASRRCTSHDGTVTTSSSRPRSAQLKCRKQRSEPKRSASAWKSCDSIAPSATATQALPHSDAMWRGQPRDSVGSTKGRERVQWRARRCHVGGVAGLFGRRRYSTLMQPPVRLVIPRELRSNPVHITTERRVLLASAG